MGFRYCDQLSSRDGINENISVACLRIQSSNQADTEHDRRSNGEHSDQTSTIWNNERKSKWTSGLIVETSEENPFQVKRSLQNFRREAPYQMAIFGVTYLTAEYQWNKDELLSCIDGQFDDVTLSKKTSFSLGITLHDLEAFIPRMLTRLYTDSLMYGNLTKEVRWTARSLCRSLIDRVARHRVHGWCSRKVPSETSPSAPVSGHVVQSAWIDFTWWSDDHLDTFDHINRLFLGCNYAYTMLNDAHQLHAIEIYLQCFQQTLENNALIELFCHLVDEPCFDQLRTKEQLGYIVNSGVRRSRGVQGFRVIVQSARDLEHVNQRIELFLDSIRVSVD
jgi:insulysin